MNKQAEEYCNKILQENTEIPKSTQKRILKKGRSALEFFFMLEYGNKLTLNKWAKRWEVSTSTASIWLKEFEELYKQYTRL